MADLPSFMVDVEWHHQMLKTEVKPCCKTDDVIYYDILLNNEFQFTITADDQSTLNTSWKVAMINADKEADRSFVNAVGLAIEKQLQTSGN